MEGKYIFRSCLLIAVLIVVTGCGNTALTDTAMDAAALGRNEVKVAVGNNVKAVNMAVETVCEDLNLDRTLRGGDILIGHYVYRTPEKEDITIFTRATSAISTDVRIQYDYDSDPGNPQYIMEKLREYSVFRVAFTESDASQTVAANDQ